MKKRMVISTDRKPEDILKENKEQRTERLAGRNLSTQVIPNKKRKTRAQLKQRFDKEGY